MKTFVLTLMVFLFASSAMGSEHLMYLYQNANCTKLIGIIPVDSQLKCKKFNALSDLKDPNKAHVRSIKASANKECFKIRAKSVDYICDVYNSK